ncbi:alpha/beta hydrolase [Caulobacter sp. KR2-114]|uniref:alpha/beta hydrolase n=1 Tax=Caulobacter sp. KR2-114 TaxID=3400912 RepID=UPI003BFC4482
MTLATPKAPPGRANPPPRRRRAAARLSTALASLLTLTFGATAMTTPALAQTANAASANATADAPQDPATDTRLSPVVRAFVSQLNKDPSPFWTLPGPQVRAVLTGLQNQTPVDVSGVSITEKVISQDGRSVKLYVVRPDAAEARPPVVLFIHGGVWIAGDFENHKRLARDIAVGSGAAVVFVEYTPIPDAVFPTQLEESYAAAKWVAAHGDQIGVDGSRMAVAGNSVGGDMSAALAIMARDRGGPAFRFQALLIPATDASVDSGSYHAYATGRFLARDFMKFGWDIYAPDAAQRNNPYVSPLRATPAQLQGLPPALIVTAENDPLRDEGEAYAHKLADAGVPVTATRYGGTIHDFVLLNALRQEPATRAALQQIGDELRAHLAK